MTLRLCTETIIIYNNIEQYLHKMPALYFSAYVERQRSVNVGRWSRLVQGRRGVGQRHWRLQVQSGHWGYVDGDA